MAEYLDKSEAVDEGYLTDWYICSVGEYNDVKLNEPRWTEAHIDELTNDFIVIPKDTTAADVAPVVHAKWIICSDGYYPYCSKCKREPQGREMTKFCPNCGAKMDDDENR